MKRRITLSLVLVLSIVSVLLMSSDQTTRAQRTRLYVYDSGVITLGANQELRLMLAANLDADIVFHEFGLGLTSCDGGICKYSIISETVSNPIRLAAGEAVSIDFRRCVSPICGGVRGVIQSSSRNLRVNALIIDSTTGEVVSFTTDLVIDVSG
jgi:hypothetical protein